MGCNGSKSTRVSKEHSADDIFLVFVLGGPGSGKGTQCAKIAEDFGYKHVSTGDLFRSEVKQDTPRAAQVREIMSKGGLIPTELTVEILADTLHSLTATGGRIKLLLDGFPREVHQVEAFEKKFNRDCDCALYFDVPPEVMKERCLKRGESSDRSDDNEATITQRVDTFLKKSKPVVNHYEAKGLLQRIDANRDIDAIFEDVRSVFSAFEAKQPQQSQAHPESPPQTAPEVEPKEQAPAPAPRLSQSTEQANEQAAGEHAHEDAMQATADATAQDMPAKGITVTICGGGNAAHVAAAMFSKNGADVNLFFSFEDEAVKFKEACKAAGGVTVETKDGKYKGMPKVISSKSEDAIPQADIVLLVVPAFAHEPILRQIAPHLHHSAAVGAIPGPGAFDLVALHALGDTIKDNDITVFAGTSLPWACRFEEYGSRASLLGVKKHVDITTRPSDNEQHNADLADKLTRLHDTTGFKCRGHFLTTTLWPTNCIIHPGVCYGIWHDWDGQPLDEAPLFYQNCTPETGKILESMSNEIKATVKVLSEHGADLSHWQPIDEYMVGAYGHVIADHSSVDRIFATNDAFRGLRAPVIEQEDGKVVPNFKMRYLTEDVPHGLAVLRGVAEVCGVETPTMDLVLLWAQPLIEKEYLVDGKIQGKDVAVSGCPQRFGLTTPEAIIKGEPVQ